MDAFAARKPSARARRAAAPGTSRARSCRSTTRPASVYAADDGVREDSTPENLAKLRPFFDRKYGNVTAGNSSQVTDGAAWLRARVGGGGAASIGLSRLGRIVDTQWAALDPAQMGLGPVHAATPILQRHGLGLNDLDAWEINEAFAAQVLACLRAWAGRRRTAASELGLPARWARSTRQAQRRRRRDRARPSGRRIRRAHRAARC